MEPKNVLLRAEDIQRLNKLATQRACSANAVIRQLIQGAELK